MMLFLVSPLATENVACFLLALILNNVHVNQADSFHCSHQFVLPSKQTSVSEEYEFFWSFCGYWLLSACFAFPWNSLVPLVDIV